MAYATMNVTTSLSQLLKGLGFKVECDNTNDAVDTHQDWDALLLARHFRKAESPYCLRCSCVGCGGRLEVCFDLYRSGRVLYSFREYDVFPEEEGKPWDVLEHASRQDVIEYLDKVRDYVNNAFGVADYSLAESVVISILCHEGNGMLLGELPRSLRTKKVCEAAVSEDWRAIKYVPEEHQTAALFEIAVSLNGWAVLDIPEAARTKSLWMLAASNAECLQNGDHPVLHMEVPDIEVLKEALRWKNFDILWAVQNRPEYAGMVDELLDYAVTVGNYALDSMSYENKTPSRCEKAVRAFGLALEYVPIPLRTENICRLALENANNDNTCYGYDATASVEEFIPWGTLRQLKAEGVMPKKKNAWDHSA